MEISRKLLWNSFKVFPWYFEVKGWRLFWHFKLDNRRFVGVNIQESACWDRERTRGFFFRPVQKYSLNNFWFAFLENSLRKGKFWNPQWRYSGEPESYFILVVVYKSYAATWHVAGWQEHSKYKATPVRSCCSFTYLEGPKTFEIVFRKVLIGLIQVFFIIHWFFNHKDRM